jgi:hypothetical protein
MVCQACGKDAKGSYCKYHERAFLDLQEHHKTWVRAYGSISWREFLERLEGTQETGQWVKEVIKAELKK